MLTVFVLYLVAVLAIGIVATRRSKTKDDFLIAGRKLGPLASSLSTEATSMSGWLLMGLPGKVFSVGLSAAWVALGCIVGDYSHWRLVAGRLREKSEKIGALTLPEVVTNKEGGPLASVTRMISGAAIVFFMTAYLWAQFVATGKALSGVGELSIGYQTAVLVGGGVIIAYTVAGGFLSVVWTDVVQGTLMFFALVLLPIYCLYLVGEAGQFSTLLNMPSPADANVPMGSIWGGAIGLGIASMLMTNFGIGAAYFGQPQLCQRFMAMEYASYARVARRVALTWVTATCIGVVVLAMTAHVLMEGKVQDSEQIVLLLARELLPPWMAGIIVAAVMAAIMSSADSFLINAVASIQQDFGRFGAFAREEHSAIFSRLITIVLGVAALILAIRTDPGDPDVTVFKLAAYAWGGLSITFAIPLLYRLLAEKASNIVVSATMGSGLLLMLIWHVSGLADEVYEVIPCFVLQIVVCLLLHRFIEARGEDEPAGA